METTKSLLSLIGRSNYEKIPETISKKLEKVLEDANSKVIDLENRFNGSQKTIEKLQKDLQNDSTERENLQKLLSITESSVTELRQQLNTANNEMTVLMERIKAEEQQNDDWRKKRDDLVDENNQLQDICGRKEALIGQLKSEHAFSRQQFESEMFENDESKKSIAEMVQQRQLMLDNEEKLKEQIEQLKRELAKLTDKCNEQAAELTSANLDKMSATARLENDLRERTEKLNEANDTIRQLTESTQLLTASQCDGVSAQLKVQLNESIEMIAHYKRELDAKIKLVDLYKANFDECQAQKTLETTSLNEALRQTTERCEILEDLRDEQQVQLSELKATLEKLNAELEAADDRLKAAEKERAEHVLEKLFPRAAASNRMLKENATLTDIISQYHDSLDEIHRLEMECLQLNTKVECLTVKLQDTTSEFERQQNEHKKILKQRDELTGRVNAIVAEQNHLREKLRENSQQLANAEHENVQLKCTQKDLARQICNLLNKVATGGNEPTAHQLQFKQMGLSNEAIMKELITFDNVVELQENNQKLMLNVRELRSKVYKLEEQNVKLQSCEQIISYLERQVSDSEAACLANEDLLAMITKQKERFKQLYFDAMNYMGKQTLTEEEFVDIAPQTDSQSSATDSKILDVELKLQEKVKELQTLKEEYNEHRKQSAANFDMLKQQCESVERKVGELLSENSKLRSQENFANEQLKSSRNDIAIFKKQIQVLEARNQIYDKMIAKQEAANKKFIQKYWNTIIQLQKADNRCSYLELECRRLIDANKNLDLENNAYRRHKVTQSILERSCELAKISSERCDFEGSIQMEKQLKDQTSHFEMLKRKLEGEQHRLTEENESLKRQRDTAIIKLSDEHALAESLRAKLSEIRQQVEGKDLHIQSLRDKLQDALATGHAAACLSKKAMISKGLEMELSDKTAEIEKLHAELQEVVSKSKLFDKLKSSWEAERNVLMSDLDAFKLSDIKSKTHINELQCEIRNLSNSKNTGDDLENTKAEIKESSENIDEYSSECRELCRECKRLKDSLQTVEKNYADVHSAHSMDVQRITSLRMELNSCQERMQQMQSDKAAADELKNRTQTEWEATKKKLIDDQQELERKVDVLEKETLQLVDLLQAQNKKIASEDTLNQSAANSSTMHRVLSADELENASSEKLFGVVKYLRREKQLAVTQTEALAVENTRLLAELDMLKNRVNQLSGHVNSDSITSSNDNSVITLSAELEQLRRAVGTLNAVTDSNIRLRAENEELCNRIEYLDKNQLRLEEKLSQLLKENHEVSESKAQMNQMNKMLQENVEQLKMKVEDRERSMKQITPEKQDQRQGTDELNSIKAELASEKEKQREVTDELNSIKAELVSEKEKQRQAIEQINLMKAERSRQQQEIESRGKHLQTQDSIRMKLMQKIVKLEEALTEVKIKSETNAGNETKSIENQCIGLQTERNVTSSETVSPVTASLRKQPSSLKRSRDTKIPSPVEKVSPQSKRTRLQRGREKVSSRTDAETALDDDVDLLPGAPSDFVDGNRRNETAHGESSTTVGDDGISGRVSSDFTVEPGDSQLGRISRSSHHTEARRGRSRSSQ